MVDIFKLLKQGIFFPYKFIEGRTMKRSVDLKDIEKGEGAVIEVEGKKVAVFKDEKGNLTKLSPKCTHMGCIINWNSNKKIWQCPCHGSEFEPEGKIKQGPADKDLQRPD